MVKHKNNILHTDVHTELPSHGFVNIEGMQPVLVRIDKITYVLEMKEEYLNIPLMYGDNIEIIKFELNRPIGKSVLEYIHTDKNATTETFRIAHHTKIKKQVVDVIPLVINFNPKFRFNGFKKGDVIKVYINKHSKIKYEPKAE